MANKRNSKTSHPRKSARMARALERLSGDTTPRVKHERMALQMRIGKPPRSWPGADEVRLAVMDAAWRAEAA